MSHSIHQIFRCQHGLDPKKRRRQIQTDRGHVQSESDDDGEYDDGSV